MKAVVMLDAIHSFDSALEFLRDDPLCEEVEKEERPAEAKGRF